MTEKTRTILVSGSVSCGKSWILKKQAEYLRKQGKKVFVVGEDDKND